MESHKKNTSIWHIRICHKIVLQQKYMHLIICQNGNMQFVKFNGMDIRRAVTILLTHLPLGQMAAISQTTYSNASSWNTKFDYLLRFCWSLFLRCNWQQPSIGLDNGLAPKWRQAINGTNADPIHWRIYAALGGDVLIKEDTYLQGKVSISHKVPALIVSLGSPRSSFTVVQQLGSFCVCVQPMRDHVTL